MRLAIVVLVAACAHAPPGDGKRELSRARIAAARGESAKAIALYDRVPRFSAAWPRALFESARERARVHAYSIALGHLMTLRAPQLRAWLFPEAYAIEAEIYFRNCYYARAVAIAREFRRDVLPLRETTTDDELVVEIDLADIALARIEDASREAGGILVDADLHPRMEHISIVDDEHETYRFDGTYWPDELGNYRVRISSRCVRRKR